MSLPFFTIGILGFYYELGFLFQFHCEDTYFPPLYNTSFSDFEFPGSIEIVLGTFEDVPVLFFAGIINGDDLTFFGYLITCSGD